MTKNIMDKQLTRSQIAKYLRVSVITIDRWAKKNYLPFTLVESGTVKRKLYKAEEVLDFMKTYGH